MKDKIAITLKDVSFTRLMNTVHSGQPMYVCFNVDEAKGENIEYVDEKDICGKVSQGFEFKINEDQSEDLVVTILPHGPKARILKEAIALGVEYFDFKVRKNTTKGLIIDLIHKVENKKENTWHYLNIDKDRPVLFLDMDGVISATWLVSCREWVSKSLLKTRCDVFGDVMTEAPRQLLVDILTKYKVQVVVISSWLSTGLDKKHPSVVDFSKSLGYSDVLGSLYTGGVIMRSRYIKELVNDYKLDTWCVLDASLRYTHYDYFYFTSDHFISPDQEYGFWLKEAKQLVDILNKERI